MGMGRQQPEVSTFDPNPAGLSGGQTAASNFLQDLFSGGGQNPFQAGPLQQQSTNNLQQFLSQPAPEVQTFNQLQAPLQQMVGQAGTPFGGFQQSQQLVQAAQQPFQQNLAAAQGSLASAAPGRFSTALAQQGTDLTSRALQDFNLFQQQATQQGLGLDLQAGAQQQQGALGAAGLLGQLAGQAGAAPFQRNLQAQQASLAALNPTLQLMLGGLGFLQPQPLTPVVQDAGGGGGFGGFAQGALGGAATGATVGSVVPGIGTGIGAGVGTLLGGLGGLFG